MDPHDRPMPAPLTGGYDVDENAIRFSNYFHVLRELVHMSSGWLALVPRFEDKLRLGEHIHDDARAVSKVRRRLYELDVFKEVDVRGSVIYGRAPLTEKRSN